MKKQQNMQLLKLQKEIKQLEEEISLEDKEKDIIKNYKMREGDYQIIIKIYEANDLQLKESKLPFFTKTACDPFVEIQINGQTAQTQVRKQTNNPIFDERFCFKFPNMTLEELDRSNIVFRVYDKRTIIGKEILGAFELDWTNVYFKRNHQIYRGWLTLMDPYDQNPGITGYLLVDIAVLSNNDKVTVHDSAFIKDPMTTMQDTVTMPKLQLIDYAITIDLYRAENLIPLDAAHGNVDAYVIAKFSGNKIQTSVKTSCNPQWDERLLIGTGVPTKSKYVILEVRNKNYLTKDDIIGVIKIPFVDLEEESRPKWGHLYGPPMSGKDKQPYNYATKMQLYGQELGSHYRGRILYQITGKKDLLVTNSKQKINFKFPFKPTPVVPLKTYILRIELINGFDLPEVSGHSYIHLAIGQYATCSKQFVSSKNMKCTEFLKTLQQMKLHFPEDQTQIPDLFIYYSKGKKQSDRISFVRIKAEELLFEKSSDKGFMIYTLKGDLSLDNISNNQNGGYLTLRANLFTGIQPKAPQISQLFSKREKFRLASFVYRAKGLPPMNQRGDCDAYVKIMCSGAQSQTDVISSYNPIWNQMKEVELSTFNILHQNMELGIICTVYDRQDQKDGDQMIGNFLVCLSKNNKRKFRHQNNEKQEFLFSKPKWYPVINNKVDVGDPCVGHVLFGCALFPYSSKNFQSVNMQLQRCDSKNFQIFLIGIREMKQKQSYISQEKIELKVNVGQNQKRQGIQPNNTCESSKTSIKEGCVHFNQMLPFKVDIPRNKSLIPFIDFQVYRNDTFYAYSSISLYSAVPKLLQIEEEKKDDERKSEEESDQQTILDVENLQKQLQLIREQKKIKEAREKAERNNQGYLDKNLTDLIAPVQVAAQSTTAQSDKNKQLDSLLKQSLQTHGFSLLPNYNFARQEQMKKDSVFLSRSDRQNSSKQFEIKPVSQYDEQEQEMCSQKKLKGMNRNENDSNMRFKEEQPPREKKKKNKKNLQNQVEYNNGEKIAKDGMRDLHYRYSLNRIHENQDTQTVSNFQIDDNDRFSEVPHDQRAITYKDVQRIIQLEEEHEKEARERMENYKYAAAVKLSLFDYKKRKVDYEKETYQDYDTDEDEDLDIIPEWYKGRKILSTDFQQLISQKKKIKALPLYRGGDRIGNLDLRQKKQIANLRFIAISTNDSKYAKQREKYYQNLLKVKYFVCRIYILKGKSLISNFSGKPTTFLRITYRGIVHDFKDTTLEQEDYDPEYYICHQIPMEIPGPSTVKIEVMEVESGTIRKKNHVLGYTEIDMEERYFMKKWHLFAHKKPIQLRNLYSEYGVGTQGRLEVWVDLIEKKDWLRNPPYKIHKPPYDPFQLRIIVWSTKDCVYKNEALKSNDIFVRGFLGVSQAQETDTHWACRGVGNFNYRFKFKTNYPPKPEQMYSDQLIIQVWDRDIVGYNNLIGEKRINLNKIHRIIEKAVKRKKAVKAKMKIKEKSLTITDRFWFDVYNHKAKDEFGQLESQGKVQLSFQLVPAKISEEEMKNGFGRSEPNVFPTLQEPAGRLNFSILHPLDFCKQLCGPDLYNSACNKMICCFVIIIIGVLGYFLIGQLVATAIVG